MAESSVASSFSLETLFDRITIRLEQPSDLMLKILNKSATQVIPLCGGRNS